MQKHRLKSNKDWMMLLERAINFVMKRDNNATIGDALNLTNKNYRMWKRNQKD